MIEIDLDRQIDAPVEDVFARLLDLPGYARWLPDESESVGWALTSDGPIAVGMTYIESTKHGPETGEVVELEPPTRLVMRNRFSKLRIPLEEKLHSYELLPHGAGTSLHYHFEWKLRGPLRILERFGTRVATRDRNLVLDALKASFAPT